MPSAAILKWKIDLLATETSTTSIETYVAI